MTAKILDGKRIAEALLDDLKVRVDARMAAGGTRPGLAVVLVGGDPASGVYVRNKRRAAKKIGIRAIDYDLPATTTDAELLALIDRLNADPQVHGILVQLPLPDTAAKAVDRIVQACLHPQRRHLVGWKSKGAYVGHRLLPGLGDRAAAQVEHLLSTSSVFWSATGYGEDEHKAPWASEHFGMTTAEAMAAAGGPSVLLSSSGANWYGDTGDRPTDETGPAGQGFLADVCRQWEAATAPAEGAGIRVAHLRSGVVLSGEGGALAKQLPIFKAGLGAPLGSGRQWLSWISLQDEVDAIRHLLTADVSGPVNLVAPAPVTNREFTKTLARVVRRPRLPVKVPGFALRLALGKFADE
ncbi:MAG: hypothetical protein KY442_11435, partial [Proteobacteria bacterium]|nr:hypothetical protein [Pseudomonadota bacterium]